ncbi:MAG TPA: LLM class flavin-dependent oxidoreductase [Sphingobium sp.]
MTIRIYWEIDSAAEPRRAEAALRIAWSEKLRDPRTSRNRRRHYYEQIARAAAGTTFDGLFIRYRPESDDSQILAASLARLVPGLALIPEFPASIGSAVYAAKEAVSFQRATQGRLSWAIAPDRASEERAADGDSVADADLLARAEEFLAVARGVHGQTGFTHHGRFFAVENGGFPPPLNRVPFPPVILQGKDEDHLALSARQADIHLFNATSIAALRVQADRLDALAVVEGRSVAHAVRLAITARETPEEAPESSATTLTGSYDEVADALAAWVEAGVTHLFLAGEPSLEEAYRVGAFVLPKLRARIGAAQAAA